MPAPSRTYPRLRRACRSALRHVYRFEVVGGARVPAGGGMVVVANHESLLDPFVLGCAVDRPLRFLAKSELWRNPVLARAMTALGAIPVERGRGDVEALGVARLALDAGEAVAIFP